VRAVASEWIDRVLQGEPEAIAELNDPACGPSRWADIADHAYRNPTDVAPALFAALWPLRHSIHEMEGAPLEGCVTKGLVTTHRSARRLIGAWVDASFNAAFPAGHEAYWPWRLHQTRGLESEARRLAAEALLVELNAAGAPPALRAETEEMAIDGAHVAGDFAAAEEHARKALEFHRSTKNQRQVANMLRVIAGERLMQRDFGGAFASFDEALSLGIPFLVGFMSQFSGGSIRAAYSAEPQMRALGELRDVLGSSGPGDPELVRALAMVIETMGNDPARSEVKARYDAALALLLAGDDAQENLETVRRQLRERGAKRAASALPKKLG
jgi:hypothetical protein